MTADFYVRQIRAANLDHFEGRLSTLQWSWRLDWIWECIDIQGLADEVNRLLAADKVTS